MENFELLGHECFKNPIYDNIDLNEGNYTGSYVISNNNRFQSIYSSQNYGSFYEMYIKANFYEKSESDLIKSFEFRIINYKGPLNVGFANIVEQKDEMLFNNGDNVGVIGLRIIVSGRNNTNEMIYEVPRAWGLTKHNAKQLNIYRMLIPLDGLEINSNEQKEVFDTEFYERNGLEITHKKNVPEGHYNFDKPLYFGPKIEDISQLDFIDKIFNISTQNNNIIGPLAKDGNCHTSKMFIKE